MAVVATILFAFIFVLNDVPVCQASHFRGGTISWKLSSSSSLKVDFKFRLAFRRSYSGSYYCDSSTVNRQGIIGWGDTWLAESQGYSYNIADTGFHCTSFSTYEDWSSGENSFNYTFPHAGPWVVRYSDCCWIALVSSSGDNWSLSTSVDLRRRKDTGKINSSPVSASSPVFRLQSGCPQVIKIPVGDPDGDVVRCRWSSGSTECGGMCNSFRHADLDEISCTLRYRGNGGLGFYGVAITLEDFAYGTKDFKNARPFSQVGLQFLVQIVSRGGPCNRIPFFTGSTPSDGACVELAIGSTYRASLVAQPMDSSRRIVEISTVSPVGINLTSLRSYYNQQNELLYRREVTWSPTSADSGQHIFCFKAIGQNGAESKSRCINFLVGSNSTPEVILSTRSPTYPTAMKGPGYISWNISFSHPIKRPTNSKFIRFHLNDKEIYKIDTSSGAGVTISNNTVLHFKTPYPVLSMRGRYFITMDTGAVVGFGCSRDGPPTPGISDSRAWSFYTNGVCRSGFYLGPDLYTCIDVDECQRPSIRRKRSLARGSNDDGPESVMSRKRRAAGCPSSLRWYWGSFSSPNFPNNYDNYESCSWGITVPSGYKVRLEFHTFNTESCCDFLRIYDGPSSSSPRVAEISGYQAPCVYHSSGRSLWFYFHTDHSGTYQGFYATYAAVPTYGSHVYSSYSSSVSNSWSINPQSVSIPDWHYQCVPFTPSFKVLSYSSTASISWSSSDIHPSKTLHMSSSAASVNRGCPSSVSVWYSGSFYSPFFPNSYQSYRSWRCSWVITVPRGYHVKLKFHTLDLGSYWDSLEIRDGSSRYSPQIGYYSGLYSGCVIYSTGRSLWFYFRTDSYGSGGQGFYATYSPVPENSYMGQSSVIYPYSSNQCMRATSSALYPAVSTTNPWSSSDIQPSRTSFVSAATASVHQGCPYSESGQYSGSFSFYYPVYWSLRCPWTISVPVGYHVKLEFQTFHLGSYGSDYLEIYDGPSRYSPRIGYYSGRYYSRFAVYSTGRSLSFYFRAYGGSGRGFYATYTAVVDRSTAKPWPSLDIQPSRTSFVSSSTASVNQGCPYSKSGQYSGSFSSPYYYSSYWSGRCSWTISVPVGYHVKLEFHTLDLGSYGYDDLQMYDGSSRYSQRIGYYSGQYSGCIVYSSGRWLSFFFRAYGHGTSGRGFHATYTAVADSYSIHGGLSGVLPSMSWSQQCTRASSSMVVLSAPISSFISPSPTSRVVLVASTASASGSCSRSLFGYYGSFGSPNFPHNYPDNQDCVWSISVPYGYYVSLEFRSFSLEGGNKCPYDFVEIRDGYSSAGRLLGKFCDSGLPPKIASSGSYMRVQFRSDKSQSSRGFSANFVAISGASRPSIQPTNASRSPTMHSTRVPSPTPASGPFVLRLPANCEHSCDNYYGSYKCTCRSGYALNSDNGTCHDIDECAQNNGGCSHSCVNFAGGHYCACLQGQTMMSDNRTCVEPGISVECGDETMQITLERKHFSHFQLKRFHLKYRNCQATGLNQTHMSFKTLLNDCGTSFNETKDELFYWNEVQVDFVAVGGVISRMHEVSIPFYCVYSKKKLVSGVSYKPRKVVFAPEAGYGNMTFTIDMYTSSSYQHPYGAKDYPINVKLNSDLYVGYKVLSNKGSLEVFAENCWATPQPSPYSTPYYTFLRSGCLLDMSMSDGNFSSSSKYFTIKAFRFFNFLNGYSTVYLHCELMACHVHTANSRCSRGCEQFRRKKREARDSESPESESSKKYKLSLGPISKQPGDGGKNEKAEGSGASYQVALVGGTVAAAALALVIAIALAVLTAKYRLVRRLMNRNKVGDMYAEENSSKNNYAMEQDVEEDKQAEAEC